MPVFVPLLRLGMLLLNVYDSFKTLKKPRSRNNAEPSQRAMSTRKRNMKGCLAIWMVWTCFIIYERWIEYLVSVFVPFYSEFKSLVLLFLILTRARGAEPIYLHVIRPLLKPYTSTLDSLLEMTSILGDILVVGGLVPVHAYHSALDWWRSSRVADEKALQSDYDSDWRPTSSSTRLDITQPNGSTAFLPEPLHQLSNGHSTPNPAQQVPQIWVPPPKAIAEHIRETNGNGHIPELPLDRHTPEPTVDEWRQYPAFPSAYPPTPVATAQRSLPNQPAQMASITEDDNVETRQDFHQSLLCARELMDPNSHRTLSDDNLDIRVQHNNYQSSADTMDVDAQNSSNDENDDEEDDFNVTLRTPAHLQRLAKQRLHSLLLTSPPTSRAHSMAFTTTVDENYELSSPSRFSHFSSASSLRSPVGKRKRPPVVLSSASSDSGEDLSHPMTPPRGPNLEVRHIVPSPTSRKAPPEHVPFPSRPVTRRLVAPPLLSSHTTSSSSSNSKVVRLNLKADGPIRVSKRRKIVTETARSSSEVMNGKASAPVERRKRAAAIQSAPGMKKATTTSTRVAQIRSGPAEEDKKIGEERTGTRRSKRQISSSAK